MCVFSIQASDELSELLKIRRRQNWCQLDVEARLSTKYTAEQSVYESVSRGATNGANTEAEVHAKRDALIQHL